jgi:hypothetical protein
MRFLYNGIVNKVFGTKSLQKNAIIYFFCFKSLIQYNITNITNITNHDDCSRYGKHNCWTIWKYAH